MRRLLVRAVPANPAVETPSNEGTDNTESVVEVGEGRFLVFCLKGPNGVDAPVLDQFADRVSKRIGSKVNTMFVGLGPDDSLEIFEVDA